MKKPLYKVRTLTCEHCQATVTKRMRAGMRFCSPVCAHTSPKPHRKNGQNVACAHCGATVYVALRRLTSRSAHFCSLAHQIAWQGRGRDTYKCKTCGADFSWSPSRKTQTNPTYCSPTCRDADPSRREMLIAMNAAQQKLSPNKIERIGYTILNEIGMPYERQQVIAGKFCVDALLSDRKIVVQFDGDYWHGNPAKFPALDARQARRANLDKSQDAYLRTCGYTIIRIWETELLKHSASVTAKLRELLAQTEHMPSVHRLNLHAT